MTNEAIARTAVETTNDDALLVEVDESTMTVRFLDDDVLVGEYSFDTFASVTDGLAINAGRGIAVDADAVAQLQQFANLDAFGLRRRAA